MIKSYLLRPRFAAIDIKDNKKFYMTEKFLIEETENEDWIINKKNKNYILTIKRTINGKDEYDEKPLDEKEAEKRIRNREIENKKYKKIEHSVKKKVYSVFLPNYPQRTHLEIYLNELIGLNVMSFKFKNEEEAKNFTPPSFCLKEITDDEFYSFKNLSKQTFADIEKREKKIFSPFNKKVKTQVSTYER